VKQTRVHDNPIGCFSIKQANDFFHHAALPLTVVEIFRGDGLRNECFQFLHCRKDIENTPVTQDEGVSRRIRISSSSVSVVKGIVAFLSQLGVKSP